MRFRNSLTLLFVLLTLRTVIAQSTATLFPTAFTDSTAWTNDSQAIGCRGCGTCSCNTTTNQDYTTNASGNEWLTVSAFREFTNPGACSGQRTIVVPAGSRIASVRLDVQCRFDDGTTNQHIRWRVSRSGTSAPVVSPDIDSGTGCAYRLGNVDITGAVAQVGALSAAGLSDMEVQVSRSGSTGGSLRVSAVRLLVSFVPISNITASVSPGAACDTYAGVVQLIASGDIQGTVEWYTDGCGDSGMLLGVGNPFPVDLVEITDADGQGISVYARCVQQGVQTSNCASTAFALVTPPVITLGGNSTANAGQTITLTATASRPAPLAFNWTIDGAPISQNNVTLACGTQLLGAHTSILIIQNLQPCAAAEYSVSVTSMDGLCQPETPVGIAVDISAGPAPQVTASQTLLCEDDLSTPVTLSASSTIPGTIRWRADSCDDAVIGAGPTLVVVPPEVTTTYFAAVEAADGTPLTACGAVTITRRSRAIVTIDGASSLCRGQTLALAAQAVGGTSPMTGRWYLNGVALNDGARPSGATISGSSSFNLSISSITSAEAGDVAFRLTESGVCTPLPVSGSESVTVTVGAPPGAGQTIRNQRRCVGGEATFDATTSGTDGETMYWRRNGVRIIDGPQAGGSSAFGANTNYLVVQNLSFSDEGQYDLFVTNPCGTADSPDCGLLVLSADVGRTGGVFGSDGRYDNNDFIVFIDLFFNQDTRADIGMEGGEPGRDYTFDNNDFIVYIDFFFNGCVEP